MCRAARVRWRWRWKTGAGSKAAPRKAPGMWWLQLEMEHQRLPCAGIVLTGSVKEPEMLRTGFPDQQGMKRLPPPHPWFAFKDALGDSPWAVGMEELLRRQGDGSSAPLQWLQVTAQGRMGMGTWCWAWADGCWWLQRVNGLLVGTMGTWLCPRHPLTRAVSLGTEGGCGHRPSPGTGKVLSIQGIFPTMIPKAGMADGCPGAGATLGSPQCCGCMPQGTNRPSCVRGEGKPAKMCLCRV